MQSRLKSGFWVAAYLRRLQLNDIPVYVVSHGDDDAGAVLVKANTLDGLAKLYQRSYTLNGTREWLELASGPDRDVEEAIARQRNFDPDIWVLEVEDRDGRTLLDEDGLSG
ncbi:MAG: DUF1491 family protein [Rhodobacteraceae bacterium]|nr:DUF1491 family protein [Paracoccaceae bacterium]